MEEVINGAPSPTSDAKPRSASRPNKSHRSLGFRVRLVEEYKEYDGPMRHFCNARGVCASTFHDWLKKYDVYKAKHELNGDNDDSSRRNSEGGHFGQDIGGGHSLISDGYVDALPTTEDNLIAGMNNGKKKKRLLPSNPTWADAEDSFTILSSYVAAHSSERIRKLLRQLECEMFSEYQQVQHILCDDDKNKKKARLSPTTLPLPIPSNVEHTTTVVGMANIGGTNETNADAEAMNMNLSNNHNHLLLQEDITAPSCVSVAAVPDVIENEHVI